MRLWLAALSSVMLGCPQKAPPGNLPMGQYAVTATGGVRTCELAEVTGADFSFDLTLTRESSSAQAWITLNGYSRQGTFDGQVVTSQAQANRVFVACAKCSTRVVESITLAVLSSSQDEAAGRQCPESALDGGLVVDLDAGVVPPGQTTQGYDAVRLCGELTTTVVAAGLVDGGACEPQCDGCTVRYQLRGERR